jgi:protein involved in polysaccharide export with SLBB domain
MNNIFAPAPFQRETRGVAFLQMLIILAVASLMTGCQTDRPQEASLQRDDPPLMEELMAQVKTNAAVSSPTNVSQSVVLREGDVVKIIFPSAANLNTAQPIRRDGKITLQLVGELTAAGLTPAQLEAAVLKAYEGQLLTKEVTVYVESTIYPVFVIGSVLRPGKVLADRPLTVLEAVMEAGGFDFSKANLKKVRLIRREKGILKTAQFDLKSMLAGKDPVTPVYVMPSDIIFVPEKFQWW